MEQIKTRYNKKYDITRNKHFTMIERPGPSKHLSTLKDRYRCQQRLPILRVNHRDHKYLSNKIRMWKQCSVFICVSNNANGTLLNVNKNVLKENDQN